MFNPIHVIKGWFRSYIYATKKQKTLSEQRLEVCMECDFSVKKKFLNFRNDGTADNIELKACTFCGCPCREKSLVESETCPMGLWKK